MFLGIPNLLKYISMRIKKQAKYFLNLSFTFSSTCF